MSEKCKWAGTNRPRVIDGRHGPECPAGAVSDDLRDERCAGCLPCPSTHCGVCRRAHANVTCAECVGYTRDDLDQIRVMCGVLPAESRIRGVNSEAFILDGPAANAEAWGNRARSATLGRVDAAYLEDCRDEKHPLYVMGDWSEVWRDHLDQPTDMTVTIERAADYLDAKLHLMAELEEPDFPQFASEIRGCRAHLQSVLHDQDQGDVANVGCFECGEVIERKLTKAGFEDVWTCRRCHQKYTQAEYNFALRASLEKARAKAS